MCGFVHGLVQEISESSLKHVKWLNVTRARSMHSINDMDL